MNPRNVVVFAILALAVLSCASSAPRSPDDEEQLLALHEQSLRAHRESNVDLLVEAQGDGFTVVSAGEVFHSSAEDTRKSLGPYLEATRFSVYRDKIPPEVKISADGSLGWVIAQVEAKGEQTTSQGKVEPLEFVSAWISLYEKRGGRWVAIGNVSNFKPSA